MLYFDLEKQLKNEILPCYIIDGDDTFLMDKAIQTIKNACQICFEDINVNFFDFESFSAKKVIESCYQLPFGCDKRLVVVKNIDKFLEADKKGIIEYLNNPNESTVLLLVDSFNKTIFKDIPAMHISCNKLVGLNLKNVIVEQLNKFGKTINADAYEILIEFCALGTYQILGEINKLCFYIGEKNCIEVDDVKLLVSKTLDFEVFELTNALSQKNINKAILIINEMLKQKDVNGVISLVSSNFRRMFYSVISKDSTDLQIANMLKVKEYAITKAKQLAKNFSPMKLKRICELITEVDFMVKSGAMAQTNALYFMIFNIAQI